MRGAILVGLTLLLTACAAATPQVSPERRAAITAAADACLPEHPTVVRYDMDRWGNVTAYYRDNQGQTAATAPYFQCIRARLGTSPAAPSTAPVTGSESPAPPATARPPSRTADRLQELDALRSQRLITEQEYQATRKRILEGL